MPKKVLSKPICIYQETIFTQLKFLLFIYLECSSCFRQKEFIHFKLSMAGKNESNSAPT